MTDSMNARRTVLRGIAAAALVTTSATALAVAPADAANKVNVRPYLKVRLAKGARGTAVLVLQAALGFRKSNQDGYFGPATRTAVLAFQRKRRLRATGIVDEATWRMLGGLPTAAQELAAKKEADARARRAKAEADARRDKAKADGEARKRAAIEARRNAAANAAAKAELDARTANQARRAALLSSTATSVHAPGLALATDPAWHVARRLTYGPTPGLVGHIRKVGPSAWIDQQLNPTSIDDTACDTIVTKTWPLLNASWADLFKIKGADGDTVGPGYSNTWVERATYTRRIFSQRQLFEMVVEMWHDHLHVTLGSDKVWGTFPSYDAMIRQHAFGTFTDMLRAAMTHPAMLAYLDNTTSFRERANENLGRELLELHTVGAGQFTEADVKQSALALTGHTHDSQYSYVYSAWYHYVGPVQVMEFSHPNPTEHSGPDLLNAYLTYLATHPATARRIAEKMCRRFVSDTPSPELISDVAAAFTANKTAIVPTLRYLLNHAEFKAAHAQKFRRPTEYVTATYRAAGTTWINPTLSSTDPVGLGQPCNWVNYFTHRLHHEPLAWPAPNGYPDVAPAWQSVSGLIVRINLPYHLVWHNTDETVRVGNWQTVFGITPTMSAYDVVDTLTEKISGYPFKQTHRDNLASFLWDTNGPTPPRFLDPVGETPLAARLPELVRLILASPYMNLR